MIAETSERMGVSGSEDAATGTISRTIAIGRQVLKSIESAAAAVFGGLASSQVPTLGTAAIMVVAAAGFVAFAPGTARGGGFICQDFNGLNGGAAYAGGSANSVACGVSANSNGFVSTAVGWAAGAIADYSVALGYLANAG